MRRMHWWGAAAGVGMLAVAAAGAPAAFAARSTPPKPSVPKTTVRVPAAPARLVVKNGHDDGDDRNGHGPGHHPGCEYPPHGRPDVGIDGQHRVKKNTAFTITGSMKVNGCGYEHYKAVLYKFVDAGQHHQTWTRVGDQLTNKDGGVTFAGVTADHTTTFRIFTVPDHGLAPGQSGPHIVEVSYRDRDARH